MRVLSLVFAVIIWLFVTWDGTTMSTSEISVPLRYVDTPDGYSISNAAGEVKVSVEGRIDLLALMGSNSIRATVSVQDMMPGKYRLPVHLSVPDGVRIVSYSPQVVETELNRLIERTLRPSLVLTDSPPSGTSFGNADIQPGEVVVKGPEADVLAVRRAEIRLSASDLKAGASKEAEVILVSDAGEVKGLTVEPAAVSVIVSLSEVKNEVMVPVRVNVVGIPGGGMDIASVTISPDTVALRLTGTDSPPITELILDDINVAGHTEDVNIDVPIEAPAPGTVLGGPSSVNVRVRFRSALETRTFLGIPVKVGGESQYKKWSISPPSVSVTLERLVDASEPFDLGNPPFELYVDVTNVVSPRMVLPVLVRNVAVGMKVLRTEPSQVSIEAATQ